MALPTPVYDEPIGPLPRPPAGSPVPGGPKSGLAGTAAKFGKFGRAAAAGLSGPMGVMLLAAQALFMLNGVLDEYQTNQDATLFAGFQHQQLLSQLEALGDEKLFNQFAPALEEIGSMRGGVDVGRTATEDANLQAILQGHQQDLAGISVSKQPSLAEQINMQSLI